MYRFISWYMSISKSCGASVLYKYVPTNASQNSRTGRPTGDSTFSDMYVICGSSGALSETKQVFIKKNINNATCVY